MVKLDYLSERMSFVKLVALLGFSLGIHLLFWLLAHYDSQPFMQIDSVEYLNLAKEIFTQSDFSNQSRTPIYPAFLGFFTEYLGFSKAGFALVQIAVSLLNIVLIWHLSAFFLSSRSQFWLVLVFCLDLVTVQVMTYILSEGIFSTCLLVGLNCVVYLKLCRVHYFLAILAGLSLGIFALTRPVGQFLPWLLIVWFLVKNQMIWREKLVAALIIALCSVGVLELWKQRMYQKTGHRFISVTTSINLYNYRAAWNIARKEGRQFEEVKKEFQRNRNKFVGDNPELDQYQVAQHFSKEGLAIIKSTPWQTIEQGVRGLVFLYGGIYNASIDRFFGDSFIATIVKLFSYIYWALIYLGMCLCLKNIQRFSAREYEVIALAVICVGYFTFLSAAVESYARLRMPFSPYLIILSVMGWHSLFNVRLRKSVQ